MSRQNPIQVIGLIRHAHPKKMGEIQEARFGSLSYKGTMTAAITSGIIWSRMQHNVDGIMTSPSERSKDSGKVFLAMGSLFHRGWKPPAPTKVDERLTPWDESTTGEIQKCWREFEDYRDRTGDRDLARLAFSTPDPYLRGLARSGGDGTDAILSLAGDKEGYYFVVGAHSPNIDAIALCILGVANAARVTGFTHENVITHLGGYARPGEGYVFVRNLTTGVVQVKPMRWPRWLEAAMPFLDEDGVNIVKSIKKWITAKS